MEINLEYRIKFDHGINLEYRIEFDHGINFEYRIKFDHEITLTTADMCTTEYICRHSNTKDSMDMNLFQTISFIDKFP